MFLTLIWNYVCLNVQVRWWCLNFPIFLHLTAWNVLMEPLAKIRLKFVVGAQILVPSLFPREVTLPMLISEHLFCCWRMTIANCFIGHKKSKSSLFRADGNAICKNSLSFSCFRLTWHLFFLFWDTLHLQQLTPPPFLIPHLDHEKINLF